MPCRAFLRRFAGLKVASLLLFSVAAVAATGKCTYAAPSKWVVVERVIDGDTVVAQDLGKIRLLGLDTPEVSSRTARLDPYGPEATRFTRRILLNQRVRLEWNERRKDDYGRWLAYLFLENGAFFNEMLVREGLAVATPSRDDRYASRLLAAEDTARQKGLGVWSVFPPELRTAPFHGNRKSRYYHAATCTSYRCPNCVVTLSSRVEAESRGFRPHWDCIRPW